MLSLTTVVLLANDAETEKVLNFNAKALSANPNFKLLNQKVVKKEKLGDNTNWYAYSLELKILENASKREINTPYFLFSNGEFITMSMVDMKSERRYGDDIIMQAQQKEMEKQKIEQQKVLDSMSPLELTKEALKLEFGKGSSQYEFVVFTDPECPYCKRAEDVIVKKDVTVYINYMPLEFHKNAREWSLDILSSTDPKQVLADIKTGKEVKIKHTKEAKAQLAKMEALAKKMNVTGTPKLFVIDKTANKIVDVINGANIPQIEKYLSK